MDVIYQMDPFQTLSLLRLMVARHERLTSEPYGDADTEEYMEIADTMCEYFSALDDWLSKGGFSPWDKPEQW